MRQDSGDELRHAARPVSADLPPDSPEGDAARHVDALVERARSLLGSDGYRHCFELALAAMTAEIRADLEAFGVRYDRWFSERSLDESGALKNAIERLDDNGRVERSEE